MVAFHITSHTPLLGAAVSSFAILDTERQPDPGISYVCTLVLRTVLAREQVSMLRNQLTCNKHRIMGTLAPWVLMGNEICRRGA